MATLRQAITSAVRIVTACSRPLRQNGRACAAKAALRWLGLACLPVLLAACGGGNSSSPPTQVIATAGDSQVTLSWNGDAGVEYWIFLAPDQTISPSNFVSVPGSRVIRNASNPQSIVPLNNGTTYWFTINGRTNNGPGGSATPAVSATPRAAGSVWRLGTALGTADLNGAAFGAAGYVAVGAGGAIFSSTDALTWSAQMSGVTNDLNAVAYLNGVYVAVGTNGITLRSTDAKTWTAVVAGNQTLYGVAPQGTGFIAAGAAGTLVTSPDGTTWTAQSSGTTANLRRVIVGNAIYVAVGDSGAIVSSTDLVTWTARAAGTGGTLRSVAYGLGRFVAVGDQGVITTSVDALTWTLSAVPTTDTLNAVAVGSQFVAAGINGRILTSTDGLTWQVATSGTAGTIFGLTATGTSFLAVGAAGLNLFSF